MPGGQEPTNTPDESQADVQDTDTGNTAEPAVSGQEPRTFDAEYVKKLRDENAKYRKRAQELERAQMSEAERLKAERDEAVTARESAERDLRMERTRTAIHAAAHEHNLVPEDVERFLEWDESTDIPKAVAQLAKTKPYLVQHRPESPAVANAGRASASRGTFSRSQLRDQSFFREHEAEIMAAAKEGRITDD